MQRDSSGPAGARVTGGARLLVIAVCLVLGWHFLATYTWNATANATREVIGQETLNSYMLPMFGQSWSVFAPNPGSVNQSLEVRAQVTSGDVTSTTEWYSLTDRAAREDIQLHLIPSRMYLNDFILANRYYDAFMAIDVEARDTAGSSYVTDTWPDQLQGDLLAKLNVDSSAAVDTFIKYERSTVNLASEVAHARWGDGVTAVQVRVLKTPVVPFAERNTNASTTVSYFVDGWRFPTYVDELDQGTFESIFSLGATQ
ncbi:MAG: hypothetical protein JWQ43_380 [Glaciihabitans sp.]|nr:hypothetical protein [Glaciihabitans sp.]